MALEPEPPDPTSQSDLTDAPPTDFPEESWV